MLSQKKLLGFYLIFSLVLSIISLATFLSMEAAFNSIGYLGIALSMRTLSSCILGYNANHIIQKISVYNSFVLSFVLGIISILFIFIGFHYSNFLVLLLGIVLIGLPITLTTILLTITLRRVSDNSTAFRKYSGSRELIFGFSRLVACIAAPILLLKIGINNLILCNFVIYFVVLILFCGLDIKQFVNEKPPTPIIKINYLILKSKDTWIFICQTTASLSLIALIPLLASSDQILLSKQFPPLLRQSLWGVEALTMIFGSFIYILAKWFRNSETIKAVLMLNSVFLFLFLYFEHPIALLLVILLISMSVMSSFYIYRDDYVITAGTDLRLIEAHSAFSSVVKDLICSISPIFLSYLLVSFRIDMAILSIFAIQLALFIGYILLSMGASDLQVKTTKGV